MEDLPIQLRFFKKLELYQKLKDEDLKQKTAKELEDVWLNEKIILAWTKTHHFRGTPIGIVFVSNHVLKNVPFDRIEQNLKNLVQKGYATEHKQPFTREYEIVFTHEGMLMGEVVNESGNFKGKLKYEFFYCITWTVVIATILTIILNFIKYFTLIIIKPTIF